MKRMLIGFAAIVMLTVVSANAFSQGRQGRKQGQGQRHALSGTGMQQRGANLGANAQSGRSAGGSLANATSEDLLRMWEEEKLARDVYTSLAKSSSQPVFANIAAAESRHMQTIERLIQTGAGTAKLNDTVGVFSFPEYQKLFQSLIASGSRSQLDALMVGAKIEEMDIADLRQLLSQTTDRRSLQVLGNLMRGSENHLRAFASQIANSGGSYEAQFLTQADFDRIANSSGQGQGNQFAGAGSGNRGQVGRAYGRQFTSNSQGVGGHGHRTMNRGGGRRGR